MVHAGIPRMGYGHLGRPWIGICVILDGNFFDFFSQKTGQRSVKISMALYRLKKLPSTVQSIIVFTLTTLDRFLSVVFAI